MRRVALVTGGARGIGRGVALRLASEGWHVAICYRTSRDEAAETVGVLESHGVEAMAEAADVGEPAQAARLYAQVTSRLGPPSALVHAAGPYRRVDVLAETADGWREMIAGNLDSLFHCARLAAPSMIAQGWGRIVAYSMANADRMVGMPAIGGHYVAKVGVLALVRTLARALAPHGITVNAVAPGYIDSGSAPAEELEAALPRIPAGRLGSVDDVVTATAFLLSDEAAYVNGTSLTVSGAWGVSRPRRLWLLVVRPPAFTAVRTRRTLWLLVVSPPAFTPVRTRRTLWLLVVSPPDFTLVFVFMGPSVPLASGTGAARACRAKKISRRRSASRSAAPPRPCGPRRGRRRCGRPARGRTRRRAGCRR